MARGNYREYLQGEQVRAKKYLYVLRPILAALWTMRRADIPPMAFETLVDAMVTDPQVRCDIAELLVAKRQVAEAGLMPRKPSLNAFIESTLTELAGFAAPAASCDYALLDALLADAVLQQLPR